MKRQCDLCSGAGCDNQMNDCERCGGTGSLGSDDDPVALTGERKKQHGDWTSQAYLAAQLKHVMHGEDNFRHLPSYQTEALDMIAVKISRILSGDPNHADHWDDIAGYAYLGKGGHGK